MAAPFHYVTRSPGCCFRIGTSKGLKKVSSNVHNTGSCYLLEILFKISDEHSHPSYNYGRRNLWALGLQSLTVHSRVTEHFKMALLINLCPHGEGKLHAAGPCRHLIGENFRSLNNSMECKNIISYKNGKNNLSRKYTELFFSMLIEI